MIITFASSKGGVGKSTSCACLAGAFAAQGQSVHIVDLDGNQTVSRWLASTEALSILTANTTRAANRVSADRTAIAAAQNHAHLEARINALKRDLAHADPEPLTLAELHARYGRPASFATRVMVPRISPNWSHRAGASGNTPRDGSHGA